jgi:uncharacterized membrane protein YbhN (UPF0104 family)
VIGARNLPLLRGVLAALGVAALVGWAAREKALEAGADWPALLAAFLVSQLSFALYAGRFRAVMRIAGVALSFGRALRISALALFYHFFVPLSVGNDLTRFALARAAAPLRSAGHVVGGILLDHAIGSIALVLLGALLLLACPPAAWHGWSTPVAAGATGALGLAIWALTAPRRQPWLRRLWRHRLEVQAALLLSLGMHALLAAAVFLGSRALRVEAGYHEIMLVLAISALAQFVPLNLLGWHAGDLAGTGLYLSLGLALHDALLLVSLLYCFRVAVAVAGGLCDLGRLGARRPAVAGCQ